MHLTAEFPSMTPADRAQRFSEISPFRAFVNEDESITLWAEYEADFKYQRFDDLFVDGVFQSIKLEVNRITDGDLVLLGNAVQIRHLNLKANQQLTAEVLKWLPRDIGLQTLDIAITSIGTKDIAEILKFPSLTTVWGHRDQFDDTALEIAKCIRPDLKWALIY